MLQSLTSDRDLDATLEAVARLIRPGGRFVIDLVPDVPQWREYDNQVQLRGHAGKRHLTLIERTLTVAQMTERLERAGFAVDQLFGDYDRRPWGSDADAWILVATRRPAPARRRRTPRRRRNRAS
jgi:hypothetical protein